MAVNEFTGLYHDLYAINYDFSDIDYNSAIAEFKDLLDDISSTGLEPNVHQGSEKSLILVVRAPRELLQKAVFNSRIKDWLHGVTAIKPEVGIEALAGISESENLRSMYHLVTWNKTLKGAGITPGIGKWKNVKSVFPLHNEAATRALLAKFSRHLMLKVEDLDQIKDIFGEKVALYFAFIQTYFIALVFPSTTGILAWYYLPGYSLSYAIITSLWCTVFLEYWKVKEVDLSLRWSVRGVGSLKVNRPQFVSDYECTDPMTGEKRPYFPRWKHIARLLLQIPFALIALVALGALISFVFSIELFISEVYDGQLKFYLEYLPTVLLAVSLPFISNVFEFLAAMLTEYENHRTQDSHEMAHTQKIFVLSSITKYLPILLTAFVYIPYGEIIVKAFEDLIFWSGLSKTIVLHQFSVDSSRLRTEVVALVVTEQVFGFGEELLLPIIKRKATRWYATAIRPRVWGHSSAPILDSPSQCSTDDNIPRQARYEAELENYNVQDDIQEMVIQFGYLALFSPVWPLIPVGFFINNWIELRSDFLKICIEHQRPAPIRADSIGPWIDSLAFLNWLGSITTAAIVYLFRSGVEGEGFRVGTLHALAATVFVSEHVFLAVRYIVRISIEKIGSDCVRREAKEQYLRRERTLKGYDTDAKRDFNDGSGDRRVDVKRGPTIILWQDEAYTKSLEAGLRCIRNAADVKKKD